MRAFKKPIALAKLAMPRLVRRIKRTRLARKLAQEKIPEIAAGLERAKSRIASAESDLAFWKKLLQENKEKQKAKSQEKKQAKSRRKSALAINGFLKEAERKKDLAEKESEKLQALLERKRRQLERQRN